VFVISDSKELAVNGESGSNNNALILEPNVGLNGLSNSFVNNKFLIDLITAVSLYDKATSPVTGFLVKVKSISEYMFSCLVAILYLLRLN
jgi:hypothetical protein